MLDYPAIHDAKYRNRPDYRHDLQPTGIPTRSVLEVISILPSRASILEIGAGPGKNVIPLLDAGHSITTEEVSPVAIEDLRRNTAKYGDRVNIILTDGVTYDHQEQYDCGIITYVLHFMTPIDAESTLQRIKISIKSGGYLVLEGFDSQNSNTQENRFFPDIGFLETYFPDWAVIQSYQYKKDATLRADMSRFVCILQKN